MELAFWTLFSLVVYTYFLYPLLLWPVSWWRARRPFPQATGVLPSVSMIVAAYNEEKVIADKVANFLQTRYAGEIELLIGSDASADATVERARAAADAAAHIRVFDFEERSGKTGIINKLVPEARGEIVVLSDANTLYDEDAVERLVARFADPRIGAACGKLELQRGEEGCWEEGLYWWYENTIKAMEGQAEALTSLNGQVLAIRKALFEALPPATLVDDLVIGMRVLARGYKVGFAPEARVREEVSFFEEEFRRRVRIGMGNFQALYFVPQLLDPRRGWRAFSFWSHKVLRWSVPFLLLGMLGLNALLLDRELYRWLFVGQGTFYLLSVLTWLSARLRQWRLLALIHYFVMMNLALLVGFYRLLRNPPARAGWESTKRL